MRGAKPWGYFGLSNAVAMSGPSAYMLVSGAPAAQEQCLVAAGGGVDAKPCVDAIVAGTGAEVFSSSAEGQLQVLGGSCLGVVAGKVSLVECQEGQGSWVVSQDGQVKQGNTCLVVAGSKVAAADCDDAASWQFQSVTLRLCLRCRRWERCCVPAWKGSEVWWSPCSVSLQGLGLAGP